MKKVTLKNPFGGMTQWLYQRFTAFFMIFYFLIIAFYTLTEPFTFETWNYFMSSLTMRITTMAFFFFMIIHAWIGVQHVTDDYIKPVLLKWSINTIFLIITLAQMVYLPYCLLGDFHA